MVVCGTPPVTSPLSPQFQVTRGTKSAPRPVLPVSINLCLLDPVFVVKSILCSEPSSSTDSIRKRIPQHLNPVVVLRRIDETALVHFLSPGPDPSCGPPAKKRRVESLTSHSSSSPPCDFQASRLRPSDPDHCGGPPAKLRRVDTTKSHLPGPPSPRPDEHHTDGGQEDAARPPSPPAQNAGHRVARVHLDIHGHDMFVSHFTFTKFHQLTETGVTTGPMTDYFQLESFPEPKDEDVEVFMGVVTARRSAPWTDVESLFCTLRHVPFVRERKDVPIMPAPREMVAEMLRDRYTTLPVPDNVRTEAGITDHIKCVVYVKRVKTATAKTGRSVWFKLADLERIVGTHYFWETEKHHRRRLGVLMAESLDHKRLHRGNVTREILPRHLMYGAMEFEKFILVDAALACLEADIRPENECPRHPVLIEWLGKLKSGNTCRCCSYTRTQFCHQRLCWYTATNTRKIHYAYYLSCPQRVGGEFKLDYSYRHDFTAVAGISFVMEGSNLWKRQWIDLRDENLPLRSSPVLTLIYYLELMADLYRLMIVAQPLSCIGYYSAVKFHCRMIAFCDRHGGCPRLVRMCDRILQIDFWPTERWFGEHLEAENEDDGNASILKWLLKDCGGVLAEMATDIKLIFGDEIAMFTTSKWLSSSNVYGSTMYSHLFTNVLGEELGIDVPEEAVLSTPATYITAPVTSEQPYIPGYVYI